MVRGFLDNGGERAYVAPTFDELDAIDGIELICPLPDASEEAIAHCERRRDRIAVLSAPCELHSGYAAAYVPQVRAGGELTPPGGHVAGALVSGATELLGLDAPPTERTFSDAEAAALVARRVNPLRGARLWSSVTLDPDPEWKYVSVRRLLIYLERSIDQGLKWAVFEPNAEPLWAAVRDAVADFLTTEWRAGKLQGATVEQAFFVKCDRTTMTQDDLDNGRLVCLVGVAPTRPAEFVIFRIGQWTADRSS
jgi:Bacteriophage tail sheath protein